MESAKAPGGRRRTGPLIYIVIPLTMFVLVYSGALQSLGKGFTLFFKNYTEAELGKLEASGFELIE
jgi:hypothetical protein